MTNLFIILHFFSHRKRLTLVKSLTTSFVLPSVITSFISSLEVSKVVK